MVERKRGALSISDMRYIRENVDRFTPTEIGKALSRTPEPIENYISKNKLGKKYMMERDSGIKTEHIILQELKVKPFYKNLLTQLLFYEVDYFCEHWVSIMMQFGGDILASEEMELKELIMLEILKNREGAAEKKRLELIDQLYNNITRERKIDKDLQDKEYIRSLQHEITEIKAASNAYVRNIKELCDRADKMRNALNGSRKLRAADLRNSKIDFASWLKWLDENDNKIKVGREMEIIRLAKEKESKRLAQYYTYANKEVTRPILNEETVRDE